jgi:integrase
MEELRAMDSVGARALEFAVLTAARTGEVLGARWDEIDFNAATWTVPAERMKAEQLHRVPLSPAAIDVLKPLADMAFSPFVFPGLKRGQPMSNMTMRAVLRRMGRTEITTHGFRSTFRQWCAERTAFAREIAEAALAHTNPDDVESGLSA